MVTLKIAGLAVALLFGFGFTPTYLDYLPLGRALRRGVASGRANPSFVVGAVLVCASLIPIVMLDYALLNATQAAAVVIGFVVAFVVAALAAVAFTPGPKGLDLGPPARGYIEQFLDEGEG